MGLDYGTYRPGPSTTGTARLFLAPFEAVQGDFIITAPGEYKVKEVFGRVIVRTAGTVIIGAQRIRGGRGYTAQTALVDAMHASCTDVRVQDCDLWPDYPSIYLDAVRGHHITVERCDGKHTVDVLGTFNIKDANATAVRAYGNWFHDMAGYYPDTATPSHTDGTHNDCWQCQSGLDNASVGNFFDAWLAGSDAKTLAGAPVGNVARRQANASIMVSPNIGGANAKINSKRDWFAGGGYGQVNIDPRETDYGAVVEGRWSRDAKAGPDWTLNTNKKPGTQYSNVYADDGTPIRVR